MGYNAVGVDVANSATGDKAALAWGQGHVLMEIQEFQCKNATHLAYNLLWESPDLIAREYHDYQTSTIYDYGVPSDCIGIDAVGVGVATVNAFEDMGYTVQALQGGYWEEAIPKEERRDPKTGNIVEKLMYRFASLRAQMYWELREDLRKRQISIQVSDHSKLNQLKKELCIPKFESSNAHITVEAKESIKKRMGGKSPNIADAVAYWNWMRKGYRMQSFYSSAISAGN
jgi:hypothetical protein